jgi:aspartyl-tRNA(Asn)/glutamyl-tRNA(Gln) amidotransferase subunit B
LLAIRLTDEWKNAILKDYPELPLERRARLVESYGLPEYDAEILTVERTLSDYFENTVKAYQGDPKRVSNWIMNDVLRLVNEMGIPAFELKLTPQFLAEIIKLIDGGTINTSTGKSLLAKVEASGKSPVKIVEDEGLAKVSDDSAIRDVCAKIMAASPTETAAYKSGKVTLIGWFVGQVMKEMRGKADPQIARKIMEEVLGQ